MNVKFLEAYYKITSLLLAMWLLHYLHFNIYKENYYVSVCAFIVLVCSLAVIDFYIIKIHKK